jgi:hypothetical protein
MCRCAWCQSTTDSHAKLSLRNFRILEGDGGPLRGKPDFHAMWSWRGICNIFQWTFSLHVKVDRKMFQIPLQSCCSLVMFFHKSMMHFVECVCSFALLLTGHTDLWSLSIGELQLWWKYVINQVKNFGNTCSCDKRTTAIVLQVTVWFIVLTTLVIGQCLIGRVVRWLWAQLLKKT